MTPTTQAVAAGKAVALPIPAPEATAPRIRWYRRLLRNRSVVVGAAIFLVFLLAAIFASQISTHVPTRLNPPQRLKPPSAANFLGRTSLAGMSTA